MRFVLHFEHVAVVFCGDPLLSFLKMTVIFGKDSIDGEQGLFKTLSRSIYMYTSLMI